MTVMTVEEAIAKIEEEKIFYHDGESDLCALCEAWEILKSAVLAQQTNNSAMVPYECVHGISINEDCAVCKEYMGVDRRVIVQHQ